MARDRSPVLKRCRSLGIEPAVLGVSKKASKRNPKANVRSKKLSEYGLQLREKQKVKFIYGLLEKQFYNLYLKANKMKGIPGENLLSLLERRLDNTVFRLGFARTRPEARQFVTHGHVLVNGKKVDIPSALVKVNDVIEIRQKSRESNHVKEVLEETSAFIMPSWLSLDREKAKGTVTALPVRSDIDFDIEERLIIELFAK